MKKKQYCIVVLGEASHVYMTCSHLAKELKNTNIKLVAVIINVKSEDSVKHAFTPFSPAFSAVLSSPEAPSNTLEAVSITTHQHPETLSFNFADYGEPSAAVNFHQAYDACKKRDQNIPSMGAFLKRDKKSFGICYRQSKAAQIFKSQCFNENIYSIVTQKVSPTIQNDSIKNLVTEEGQTIAGDLYIDCSSGQVLMSQLQPRTQISNKTIPNYRIERMLKPAAEKPQSKITSEKNTVVCHLGTTDQAEERRYVFGQDEYREAFHYSQPWLNNCVALGHGYCELPELLICKDRILETQLHILALFLPITSNFASAQSHFAMHSQRILDDAIDSANLLIADACPTAELSQTNTVRKGLFESSGGTHQRELSIINNSCWGALLRQVGIEPKSTNALAQARPVADMSQKLLQLVTGE